MSAIAFDTLAYAKKLKLAGVPEAQAEVQAEAMAELVEERLATKRDLKELEERLASQMRGMEERLNSKMQELEYKMTVRLGSMMVVARACGNVGEATLTSRRTDWEQSLSTLRLPKILPHPSQRHQREIVPIHIVIDHETPLQLCALGKAFFHFLDL